MTLTTIANTSSQPHASTLQRDGHRKNGSRVCDIGKTIEKHAHSNQLSVVREFIGHGVGPNSTALSLFLTTMTDATELTTGMSFTIEPMLNLGGHILHMWDDTWTVVTTDGRRSAQFEHTLIVTDDGFEIMTISHQAQSQQNTSQTTATGSQFAKPENRKHRIMTDKKPVSSSSGTENLT